MSLRGCAHVNGGSETKPFTPHLISRGEGRCTTSGLPLQSIITELLTSIRIFLKRAVGGGGPISAEIGECDAAAAPSRADPDDLTGYDRPPQHTASRCLHSRQ